MKGRVKIIFIILLVTRFSVAGFSQIKIGGTVYDSMGLVPIPFVSVLSTTGKGAVTDSKGKYSFDVNETDSIWFSYLNKPTHKFAVKDIPVPYAFDISLQIYIPVLPEARVQNRNYKLDSIENRETYAKIFDFDKPGLSISSVNNGAVGFDLDELINVFRFRRTKHMLAFQQRLLNEEQERFIKHRFSKALVRRLTPLNDDTAITQFIETYMPSFLFAKMSSDYAFQKYIKDSYERFKNGIAPSPLWLEGSFSD